MEPVAWTEVELASLADESMVSVIELAKHQQDVYRVLPVAVIHTSDRPMISRWTFTDDERKRISEGADLYLKQLTFGRRYQPILPSLDLVDVAPCPMSDANVDVDANTPHAAKVDA